MQGLPNHLPGRFRPLPIIYILHSLSPRCEMNLFLSGYISTTYLKSRQGSNLNPVCFNPAITPPGSSMLPSHSSADKSSSTRDKLSSFLSPPWLPSPVSGLLLVNILLPADSEVGATFEGVSTVLHSRGQALRWLQQDKHCVLCTLKTKLVLSGTQRGPWGRTHERRHTSVLLLCAVRTTHRYRQIFHGQIKLHSSYPNAFSALLSFVNLYILGCIAQIFLPYLGGELGLRGAKTPFGRKGVLPGLATT